MPIRTTAAAITTLLMFAGAAGAQDYSEPFQWKYGGNAQFFVEGPATEEEPDVEGDAILKRVVMPTGETFRFFYKPEEVLDLHWFGSDSYRRHWSIRGGLRTTTPIHGNFPFGTMDGNMGDVTQEDIDGFASLALTAFANDNLNNYIDTSSNGARWEFTIKFGMVVKDDDPEPDEFGEILYFERGRGHGNSWLKMQAVDEAGTPLGPWLVVGPRETVHTTPRTAVMRNDQKIGTTAIDVSRLGVEEFQYLRISNRVKDEPAYTRGGDLNPDFKIMVVVTNEEQLTQLIGGYD